MYLNTGHRMILRHRFGKGGQLPFGTNTGTIKNLLPP